ncbi:MAG: mechanosensitive ion channel family protein [Actinomycetota bacterium]
MNWGEIPWSEIVQSAVVLAVAIAVWLVARSGIRRWTRRTRAKLESTGDLKDRARSQRLETISRTLSAIVALVVFVIAFLMVLALLGVPIAPIVASLSVVGIAIGFGAQDLIKDMIAGFFVLLEDQYAVGDVVELSGASGTVEELRLRTTVLRGLDGSVYHIPNGQVHIAKNLTHEFSRLVVDVSVGYEGPVDRAIAVIADESAAFAADEDWSHLLVEEPQMLGVNELGESSVAIRVLLTTDPDERWTIKREFLRRIKNRLDAEGIEIPFPQVTISRKPE